jgi:hypothetical protein
MKKLLLGIILLMNTLMYSQDFTELNSKIQKFKTQEEYDSVDKEILEAINFLLEKPYLDNTENYFYAHKSIIAWMNNTTNYQIQLSGKVFESCDEKSFMRNILMACMAKYLIIEHLEKDRYIHPEKVEGIKYTDLPQVKEITFKGAEFFMEYLKKQDKRLINKKLRNALKEYDKGKLEKFMFE